jgi:hypothetical protein
MTGNAQLAKTIFRLMKVNPDFPAQNVMCDHDFQNAGKEKRPLSGPFKLLIAK